MTPALQLFGLPSLTTSENSATSLVSGAKDLALLAFLTLEPGPHSREELATLLWGESPEEQARASLRQALHRLKQVLDDGLQVDRNAVRLSRPLDCDVLRFAEALSSDPAAAAAFEVPRLFRGLSVHHAPAFDEWAAGVRARVLHQYLDLLAGQARDSMLRRRWREAAEWGERWLTYDPLSEEAGRISVEARYLAGDPGAAMRRYRAFDEQLREAGMQMPPAMVKLRRQIDSDSGAPAPAALSEPRGSQDHRLKSALVGRESQWRVLTEAWQVTRSGAGQVVLVEGEPGMGKTRLADEFVRWAGVEGGRVLRGRGYDAREGTPFGPLVEALREGLDAPGLSGADPESLFEASRLLPELRRRFPGLPENPPKSHSTGRSRLFEGIAQVVIAIAAESPVVVLVDDLQWCDGDSCSLLQYLVRRWARAPVLVMACLTLGEMERDGPATRLCQALRNLKQSTVVSLTALSEDQVLSLILELGRLSPDDEPRRFARQLHQASGGNPFFLTELHRTLVTGGTLDPDGGQSFPMPATVRAAISQRIARLPDELRDPLATVVLAGQSCDPDLLSRVHAIPRLKAAVLCDELVNRRLVLEAGGGYRIAHQFIAEVVQEELTVARRQEIQRSIALGLEQK